MLGGSNKLPPKARQQRYLHYLSMTDDKLPFYLQVCRYVIKEKNMQQLIPFKTVWACLHSVQSLDLFSLSISNFNILLKRLSSLFFPAQIYKICHEEKKNQSLIKNAITETLNYLIGSQILG